VCVFDATYVSFYLAFCVSPRFAFPFSSCAHPPIHILPFIPSFIPFRVPSSASSASAYDADSFSFSSSPRPRIERGLHPRILPDLSSLSTSLQR
jgi:hypothetical protein